MIQPSDKTVALPRECVSVGLNAVANPSAVKTAAFAVTRTSGYRTDIQPIDDEALAHPSLVEAAIGNDIGRPSTRRSTWGGTNSFIRAQAVPPTKTASTTAKASPQPSDGTPIWESPSIAW
jgi:hypothetical protein